MPYREEREGSDSRRAEYEVQPVDVAQLLKIYSAYTAVSTSDMSQLSPALCRCEMLLTYFKVEHVRDDVRQSRGPVCINGLARTTASTIILTWYSPVHGACRAQTS